MDAMVQPTPKLSMIGNKRLTLICMNASITNHETMWIGSSLPLEITSIPFGAGTLSTEA
jgi:hypothetical protein